jgi:hypothetical protein
LINDDEKFNYSVQRSPPLVAIAKQTSKTLSVFFGSFKIIGAISRAHVPFRNVMILHGDRLLDPRPTPKLEDHHLLAVRDCIFKFSRLPSVSGDHIFDYKKSTSSGFELATF